jgi:DnaJ-class molecular chaperone
MWKEIIKGKTGFSSNKTKTNTQCKRCSGTGKMTRSPDGKKINCNRCSGSGLDKDNKMSTRKYR